MCLNLSYRVIADNVIKSVSSSQIVAIKEARRLAKTSRLVTVEISNGMVLGIWR